MHESNPCLKNVSILLLKQNFVTGQVALYSSGNGKPLNNSNIYPP